MKRKLSTILTVVLFLFCASLVKAQTHVPLEPEIVVNQREFDEFRIVLIGCPTLFHM